MSFPALIGITGKAGVGKDTLARYLHIMYGYHCYALAQPIKAALNRRFGWTAGQWENRVWKEARSFQCGHDGAGQFSPRSWAQWIGTEAGRELHGEDCWIRLMQREWEEVRRFVSGMVVSDVRFDNEAEAIRQLGGVVICIERTVAKPIAAHKSEAGVSSGLIDATVANNGTIAEFLADAFHVLAWLDERPRARRADAADVGVLSDSEVEHVLLASEQPADVADWSEYRQFVESLWVENGGDTDLAHAALGLVGEAGEVAELHKKYLRGDGPISREKLTKELGDVLYYWTKLCNLSDLDPRDVIRANVAKLTERKARGVIKGTGSER